MAPAEDQDHTERARTDESLGDERQKTDEELENRAATLVENADTVVARARERADEILVEARLAADEKLRQAGAPSEERRVLVDERRKEDEVLQDERAVADEELQEERDARRRALATLLDQEREQTDHHLSKERDHADESLRTRDDFLGIVSHDIRNMLGGIALSASSLMQVPAPPEVKSSIAREAKRVQRYTARMSRIVGDLLDVVSIEAGRLAVVPQPHDAAELLRETVDAFGPLAAAKRISVRAEVHGGSLLAHYDHDRVLQVLSNIVGNAIKFTREGGKVDIAARAIDREIRFGVTDTGPGIAPDKLEAVFERFWQSRKRDQAGLGLGLYIARCIVEAHGGRIWADSTPGEGSTFYFTLPAAAFASELTSGGGGSQQASLVASLAPRSAGQSPERRV